MAEEQKFLQSIKLAISKNCKLLPYERIAFHSILGIIKSEMDMAILINDLEKGDEIRSSAISNLVKFRKGDIVQKLFPYLRKDILDDEKIQILKYIEENGDELIVPDLIDFINNKISKVESDIVAAKAFNVLRVVGKNSDDVLSFIISIINSKEIDQAFIKMAILALSSFKVISSFEEMMKMEDDEINYSVFKALYTLSCELIDSEKAESDDEESLFTYSQADEDKIILDIRVFLGKIAPSFVNFSNKTKIAFISVLISSNHREFLIYLMKTITSKDPDLVTMALHTLYHNITRLRDPDKLFRNLIALSTESDRDDELIIEIFYKFFSTPKKSRQFNILKDKLYSYIVVTIETYFETFRKDFMITNVIEKSYPESFQQVRKFILERFTPDLKEEILNYLRNETPSTITQLINEIGKWVLHIKQDEVSKLYNLFEILFDSDQKSRTNSANRFEDINFEKRYLANRIVRLCHLICRLSINDGASALVNIYNYLKKYPYKKIMEAVVHTLSVLNYSYMLGEIEVQILTGSENERRRGMELISLFHEQRSLNLIIEFLKTNLNNDSDLMTLAINNLIERNIFGNVVAQNILKEIISITGNRKILSRAILCLGKCGFDSDIVYLNGLFYSTKHDDAKDMIVLSIGYIISLNTGFKRRELIKYLQEYLKDPGIKVRIYSCLLLAKLGSKESPKYIRDMMIIKNKTIQRVILLIIGELKALEMAFFFISLLTEEYGITRDIIPLIAMLTEAELKEIDDFLINIFNKLDIPEIEEIDHEKKIEELGNVIHEDTCIMKIDLFESKKSLQNKLLPDLISMNLKVRELISDVILEFNGIIIRMSNNEIIAIFNDPLRAANASMKIANNFNNHNMYKVEDQHINLSIQLVSDRVRLIKDELLDFSKYKFYDLTKFPMVNKVVVNDTFLSQIAGKISFKIIPEIITPGEGIVLNQFELLDTINFAEISNEILDKIATEDEKKQQIQIQIADELKKIKRENRSASTVTITRELDEIGIKLRKQLTEIERYVQRRSTDRELINNVKKMLANVYNLYRVEISRIIVE